MNEAATEYDDLLDEGGHPWRGRLIWLAVLAALVAVGAYILWSIVFSGGGSATESTLTATVQRGSIVNSVSTSAVTVAQSTANLSFGQSGRVTAVNVTLSQAVKQGDVLAEVESDTLQDSVTRAEVSLASAQTKLNQLLEGSTAAELASADQSLIQAQASFDKAQTTLEDLLDGPTSEELDSAQQAVLSARSQLVKAQSARANLDSTWDDAVAAAEKAVSKAEDALEKAERAADNAAADYEDCQATPPASDPTCRDALAKKEDTADAVESAQDDLDAAEDNLDELGSGPTSEDIESADAAVASAELALKMANDKLAEVNAGATEDDLVQAQHSVDAAAAALTAAQAKRNDTYQGSKQEDIDAQRDQVLLAQLSVSQAKKDLEKAQLIAPFDGTVAALNISVGDTAGTSSSSSATAAIVLNTPSAIILNVTISESDLPSVKAGLSGTAQFDAITGVSFPIVIDSVGTNPTTTQGVVNYQARARIVTGQGARGAASGRPANLPAGQAPSQPQAQGTPSADNAVSAATAVATPVPGMNATVTIIIDQRQNVLTVPSTAIQRDGRDSVVEIQNEDGSTTRQVVEMGLSDDTNTEITSGLEEGQTVIIPTLTATTSNQSQSTQQRMGPIIQFGGPGGPPEGGGIQIQGD
jgi:HlyD family secretion protein